MLTTETPGQKPHRHWHHVYRKHRRRALGISSKQIAVGQIISLIGAIIAGLHLDDNKAALAMIVGAFVIMPGVFDLNGALGGALSAKINHHLEDAKARAFKVFMHSTSFALLISVLAGSVIGFTGGTIASLFFDANFWLVFKLAFGAVLLGAIIGLPLVGLATIILRKLGVNPDDVMGPLETTFFDVLTVITLVIVAGWLA
jgi:cation transporter-like permease